MKWFGKLFLVAFATVLFHVSTASAESLGSVSGGATANQSNLMGCLNGTQSLSSGQQGAVKCDSNGNFTVTATTAPTVATTTDASGSITTGGTFQTLTAASTTRKSLDFVNVCNKSGNCTATTNNCYLYIAASGSGTTANSIIVGPGGEYLRAAGTIPSDAISGTCDGTADKFRLAIQ